MKRILAIAAAAVAVGTMVLPASAASTYTYGSVKLQWNVPLTATLNVHTNYTAAGAFGGASNTLFGSAAGVCTSQASGETDLNMNYGTLAVSPTAVVACTYKNAVAMQLTTNAKYQVNEYMDTAAEVPAGTGFCAYPNGLVFGGPGCAAATQSARAADPGVGTFTAGTITACATGGALRRDRLGHRLEHRRGADPAQRRLHRRVPRRRHGPQRHRFGDPAVRRRVGG